MGVDHKATITAYDAQCVVLLAQGVVKSSCQRSQRRASSPRRLRLRESEPDLEGGDKDSDDK